MIVSPQYQGAEGSQINLTKLDKALDVLKKAGVNFVYSQQYEKSPFKPKTQKNCLMKQLKISCGCSIVL
jgi:hypothetical protein